MLIKKKLFEYKEYKIKALLVSVGRYKKIWISTKSKNGKYRSKSCEKFSTITEFIEEFNQLEKMEKEAEKNIKNEILNKISV